MENKCPKCSGEMKKGVIIDRADFNIPAPQVWRKSAGLKITLKREDKRVSAFCCEKCGYIEHYAEKE